LALFQARGLPSTGTTPFDARIVREVWDMTAGTVRRHPWILGACTAAGLCSSFAFWQVLPRSYHAEWQLLAQKNLMMPALGNPRRSVPEDSDVPTRGAADLVLSRENLISLIKHTGLLERWPVERAPLQHLKDWASARVGKPVTDAQRLEALLGILEKRLKVSNDDTSVTVAIDWPNARTAADLLQVAEDNFLEARHASEVSTIAETIAILQGHAEEVRTVIDSTFTTLESGQGGTSTGPLLKASSGGVSPEELAQAERDARELRAIETEALGNDSVPEQAERTDRERNAERARERGAPDDDRALGMESEEATPGHEEQRVSYPKARLKIALDNYDDLRRRIDAARIELDTAEAAFKYRYRVIQPVVVPQRPTSPHGLMILASGALAGLLAGLALAFGRDLSGEVIQTAWQVRQRFKVPVLVEIRDE
jgi:uncharacterized protein involved in exopolysaccharide biosynthesis